MFSKCEDGLYFEVHKGVSRKTAVHGKQMLQCATYIENGAEVPFHDHPHEQIGYLVSGRLQIILDGKSYRAEPGDSWCVPAMDRHGAKALEDSMVIEVFSPVSRECLR